MIAIMVLRCRECLCYISDEVGLTSSLAYIILFSPRPHDQYLVVLRERARAIVVFVTRQYPRACSRPPPPCGRFLAVHLARGGVCECHRQTSLASSASVR